MGRRRRPRRLNGGGGEEEKGGGLRTYKANITYTAALILTRRFAPRINSYDSTLFGLDVFEGLQSDYLAKREKEEREHWVFKYIPVIDPQWK